jgi:hypothetical protein
MTAIGASSHRLRSWAVAIGVLLSTLLSGLLPTSMAWPGSHLVCADVAVSVAVNPDHTPTAQLLDSRIAAGHSHGPPTIINGSASNGHTYYVLAGNTPVLVHNTSPGCGTGNLQPGNSPAASQGTSVHSSTEWAEHLDSVGYQPGRALPSGARPDAFTDAGFPVELKPDSRSGITAGTRQLRRYMNEMGVDYGELWTYRVAGNGDVTFRLTGVPRSPFRWLKWW